MARDRAALCVAPDRDGEAEAVRELVAHREARGHQARLIGRTHARAEIERDAPAAVEAQLADQLGMHDQALLAAVSLCGVAPQRRRQTERELEGEREELASLAEEARARAQAHVTQARAVSGRKARGNLRRIHAAHHEVHGQREEEHHAVEEAEVRAHVGRELVLDDGEALARGDAAIVFVDERVEGVVERELRADAQVSAVVGSAQREAVLGGLGRTELVDRDARILRAGGCGKRERDEGQEEERRGTAQHGGAALSSFSRRGSATVLPRRSSRARPWTCARVRRSRATGPRSTTRGASRVSCLRAHDGGSPGPLGTRRDASTRAE